MGSDAGPQAGGTVPIDTDRGFWVFAYGSLMWNPGFDAAEKVLATLDGYHRSFCMASIVYRGTPEAPGLVLALDRQRGARCTGVAYRVGGGAGAAGCLSYLRERELVSSAYLEVVEPLTLADGRRVEALCYVMDCGHEQYRGMLDAGAQAEIIARAEGPAGSNRDYLLNTVRSLHDLGLEDPELFDLAERVRRLP
ncbi:gamma-glutamylcyclotransferase [Rhodobacteraceae bacterium 2CG4]|uniref:glutathione-specific gamma-glutamylcyclotransferase n=1 Tax=Halovulum marinum TaxID=2662447 RepID=A0A6L5Z6B7_9RHOB|nr:gamma-glutamylcyclotransferase [Halovulum marinum]MSU92111.1 gamma-glutamylcyclotransferase [Halovulum marinum]